MEQLSGYRHDVFLSYSRVGSWPRFVNKHFRPIFDHWLTAEVGRINVFQDVHSIQTGQQWPREIARGLATSRVMVALLSRNYFQSEWCLRELAAMLARVGWLRECGLDDQIIFPISIHDCEKVEDLPEPVRSLQILRLDFSSPFMTEESADREELSRALRPLCEQIAGRLSTIGDDTFLWPPPDDSKHRELLAPTRRPLPDLPVLIGRRP